MRFLPVNLDSILIELADLEETLTLFDSLQSEPIHGIEEVVPAARTLMVTFRRGAMTKEALIDNIRQRSLAKRVRAAGKCIEIPVYYNGEDLEEVAQMMQISVDEVIRRHTESEYSVAFTGFAPGFAYLSGGDPSFQIPRRKTPRTKIPAGAVALAGNFSAVYPQASPGGWQIIGITPSTMWDLSRAEPALLQPGYRVKFVNHGRTPPVMVEAQTAAPEKQKRITQCDTYLKVLKTGMQTIFQDMGRPGKVGQGVSQSGALDRTSCKAANRVVGNPSDTGCLEVIYGGLSLEAHGDVVIAVTGADVLLTVKTKEGASWTASCWTPVHLADGDIVTLGNPVAGLRNYVAVRGGFDEALVLDSVATDTLAKVGPESLSVGDQLGVKTTASLAAVSLNEAPAFTFPTAEETVTLDVVLGPRTDWFSDDAVKLLRTQVWKVTPQSNRIGIRLAGDVPLQRVNHQELPSEGTSVGAIQVPASGQPVLFLADHPLTGGYPVIGAVATYHLDLAGQIPMGACVRFNPVTTFEE